MFESEKNNIKAIILEFLEEVGLVTQEQLVIIREFLGDKRNILYKPFGIINDKLNPEALQIP